MGSRPPLSVALEVCVGDSLPPPGQAELLLPPAMTPPPHLRLALELLEVGQPLLRLALVQRAFLNLCLAAGDPGTHTRAPHVETAMCVRAGFGRWV